MPSNAAEQMLQYLRQAATELPVVLTDEQLAAFAVYYDFLLEYNEKVNLTRITEPLDVAVKHFADSLSLLQTGWLPPGGRVADIGTGAGFPGIPLAIMRPDLRVVLVDSLRKRTVFLTEAVQKLALVNVTVVWSRAEDLGRNPDFRERFDIVLARAVAELNVLTELCLPLAKPGGAFVAMKGPRRKRSWPRRAGRLRCSAAAALRLFRRRCRYWRRLAQSSGLTNNGRLPRSIPARPEFRNDCHCPPLQNKQVRVYEND